MDQLQRCSRAIEPARPRRPRRRPGLVLLAGGVLACSTGEGQLADRFGAAGIRYSLRLGGSDTEQARDVAVDPAGHLVVAGNTESPDFPVAGQVWDASFDGSGKYLSDAFATRLAPDGAIEWSTFLGGPDYERAYAVEVDARGYIYLAGRAGPGMPVTPGALQTTFAGGRDRPPYGHQDGFVCKLGPDARRLVFCTYFGNEDFVPIRDLAVDGRGDIYVVSSAERGSFPAAWFRNAFQPERRGRRDMLVAKLRGDGTGVVWATYLGGSGGEWNTNSIRVGPDGSVYVLGFSRSTDLPTPNGFDTTAGGMSDLYLARLSPDGSRLLYGTYVGGAGNEDTETHHLAVDREGNAYLAATTTSTDLPTTPGAYQPRAAGRGAEVREAFAAKVSPAGALLALTYLGGGGSDWAEGVAVDDAGRLCLSGSTDSPPFPPPVPPVRPIPPPGYRRSGAREPTCSPRSSPPT